MTDIASRARIVSQVDKLTTGLYAGYLRYSTQIHGRWADWPGDGEHAAFFSCAGPALSDNRRALVMKQLALVVAICCGTLVPAADLRAEPVVLPDFSVDNDGDGIPDAYNKGSIVGMKGMLRVGAPGEVLLQEESMCPENGGVARFRWRWNQRRNRVRLIAYTRGLPRLPSLDYQFDPSNPYNSWPTGVTAGAWQIWISSIGNRTSTYHYDASGILLGNEYDDVDPGQIASSLTVPVVHMICTDLFQARPFRRTVVRFGFKYDRMLDSAGTGGVYAGFVPFDLNDPATSSRFHYTSGGLDPALAMTWPELLQGIEDGLKTGASGVASAYSLEPDPKPEYLKARDNIMIGWGASIPSSLVADFGDPNPPCVCGNSYQLPLLDGTGIPQDCLPPATP